MPTNVLNQKLSWFKVSILFENSTTHKHMICYGVEVCLACEIDIDHKSVLLCCIYEIFYYDQVSWFMRAYYIHESIRQGPLKIWKDHSNWPWLSREDLKPLISLLRPKGGFKSDDTEEFSLCQNKYSKSLSWAENLNKLFTVLGGKFEFSAQDTDMEYLFWQWKKSSSPFWLKTTFNSFFSKFMKIYQSWENGPVLLNSTFLDPSVEISWCEFLSCLLVSDYTIHPRVVIWPPSPLVLATISFYFLKF